MNAAVIWIIFPLITSLLILLVRKYFKLSYWLQIGISLFLSIMGMVSYVDPAEKTASRFIEISSVFNVLGRSLVINSNLKNLVIVLYAFLGLWTVALFIFKIKSRVVPLGLTFLAFIVSSLAVEPFLYSALLIELAVIVSTIMVVDNNSPSKNGILRYLIYFSLGVPFVLLAGWYLAGGEITPVNAVQLIQATLLLGLGFVFWLGIFPFHSWIPLMIEENRPSESMLLITIMPAVIVMLLLKYLNGFVWLREYDVVYQGLRIFGLIMVLTGSIWAFFQQKIDRFIGYLMIYSIGSMLLSIGIKLSAGIYLASYLMFIRLSIFYILSWFLIIFKREKVNLRPDPLKGLFFFSPLLALVALAAFFSVVGMPLTPGFPVMQSLYAYLSTDNPVVLILVLASAGLVSLAFIRQSFLVFSHSDSRSEKSFKLSMVERSFFLALLLFLVLASLFPHFFLSIFENTVRGLEFLVK